ncbi:MAG: hypothetical protein DMG57_35300 [Acidobacteria bacterium]|nr:MAG: hypothetical protein DMG57_35300 [Acidobacteriota bacterium]
MGLTGDLALRPIKGLGFSAGRAALINSSGVVEAVVGNPSDCVLVDGTSGPCGSTSGTQYVEAEIPAGVVDGSNATFTLAGSPSQPSSLSLFRNGVLQQLGSDYTLTGSTVQFLAGAIPQLGDTLMAGYRLGYRLAPAWPLVGPQITGFRKLSAAPPVAQVLQQTSRVWAPASSAPTFCRPGIAWKFISTWRTRGPRLVLSSRPFGARGAGG